MIKLPNGSVSHEGCVVAIVTDRAVRIMSDVWADITYAVVYEPTGEATGPQSTGYMDKVKTGLFRRIEIENSEFSSWRDGRIVAEVDASEEVKEIYSGHLAGLAMAKAIRAYDHAQEVELADKARVDTGRWVRVTSGRKVPQGTEGLVFWTGESQWGLKVGLAVPQADGTFRKETRTGSRGRQYETYADVVWTYSKNCTVLTGPGGRLLERRY